MTTYGYCRISTTKQNIERQVRNIKAFSSDAVIVKETYTGTRFQGRAQLDKILRYIKPGDTIIFDAVSRMSRNAEEGCILYEDLFNRNINLIFLNEPHINTDVYRDALQKQIDIYINTGHAPTDKFLNNIIDALNQFVLDLAKEQIKIAFKQAEKEVTDLRQLTKQGIETARLNGKQIGQRPGNKLVIKKAINAKKVILQHSKSFGGSLSDIECMKLTGISRNSYYKYKKELKAEYNNKNTQ